MDPSQPELNLTTPEGGEPAVEGGHGTDPLVERALQSEDGGRTASERDWREGVLAGFHDWLYRLTDDKIAAQADEPDGDGPAPDLAELFGELAALRQETRLVGRGGQQTERQLGALADALRAELREQSERLAQTTGDLKAQLPAARREAQTAVLMELLLVRDTLENAECAGRTRALPAWPWLKRARELLAESGRSLQLALDKADDALRRLNVAPVASAGQAFDPKYMRAVAACPRADMTPGTVITIIRQGWRREEQLLQTADVEVSKEP